MSNYVIDGPVTLLEDRGSIYVDSFNPAITVNTSYGDITSSLDFNKLYEIRGSLGSWQFRYGSAVYLNNSNTYIYNIQWNNNLLPSGPGLYNFRVLSSERMERFGRNLCMIGDSITWWEKGGAFRDKLRVAGLKYDFSGPNMDPWGYRHCGNGGYTSQQTLDNFNSIPESDSYFILLGTNDRDGAPDTANRLLNLIFKLQQQNCCSKIYISTLLPRTDEFNARNEQINTILKSTAFTPRVILLDTGGFFKSLSNWQLLLNDGIHPTSAGYDKIVSYLWPLIK